MSRVLLSVVVASHERSLRLRWLLEALSEQTLTAASWEVVVCFDDAGSDTAELLASHRLATAGRLRSIRLPAGTGSAARQRNAGWRAARGRWVTFTDDDCRPPESWLARTLAALEAHPDAIVQGATQPDPAEAHLIAAPHARTLEITPPVPWAQTCNISYPKALLERVGGFAEELSAGEDTDLALRARKAGAEYRGAPEALTYHCVEIGGLRGRLRTLPRWSALPLVVKRHPELRRRFPLRLFWKPRHALLVPALGGVLLARRQPLALLLVLPWARAAAPSYGPGPRGRARAVAELPANVVVDVVEMTALARGSLVHRSPLL